MCSSDLFPSHDNRAMKEQWKYNKNIMALQNQYQQAAAAQSQQYAKDYWDYTNAENQARHLKNAGLNIGLMYGQSGAGGMGASGGARQESPDQAQGNPIGMALQVQQIEQQRRMNDAQIALAEAQASKAKEEAKKIGGVDTQEVLKRIEEASSRIELNLKEGNYKEALAELKKAEKEATDALTSLREMQEGLTNAEITLGLETVFLTITSAYRDWETDRKSTRLNSSHITRSRMPSSA